MKDNEKQIEEMAKDLHSTHAISSHCSGRDCNHCKYDSLKNFDEYTCIDLSLANDLYNAGYRKLPKNAIFIMGSRCSGKDYLAKIIFDSYEKGSKETVEKFVEKVKELLEQKEYKAGCSAHMMWTSTAKECVDEIAKQFGVEIKV